MIVPRIDLGPNRRLGFLYFCFNFPSLFYLFVVSMAPKAKRRKIVCDTCKRVFDTPWWKTPKNTWRRCASQSL